MRAPTRACGLEKRSGPPGKQGFGWAGPSILHNASVRSIFGADQSLSPVGEPHRRPVDGRTDEDGIIPTDNIMACRIALLPSQ